MTKDSIVEKVRRLLLDEVVGSYRWSTNEIEDYLEDAIRTIRADRPDSRYDENLNLRDEMFEVDGESTKVLIDPKFKEAIVYYIVHKCYLKDDSDTVSEQNATRFFQLYQVSVAK